MPYQPASRPQTSHANHDSPSLTSIRLLELALEEEQEVSKEFPVAPQAFQSRYSSNASQKAPLHVSLFSIQLQELALEEEEEQEFSLELPVVPQNRQSRYSSNSSQEYPSHISLTSIQLPQLALKETQETGREFPMVPLPPQRQYLSSVDQEAMSGIPFSLI
jgi:hypothetical protein